MRRLTLRLALALLWSALLLAPVEASLPGGNLAVADFNLASGNTAAEGITWDGSYFRVPDNTEKKVYAYDSEGNHVAGADFDFDTSIHTNAAGITWDGSHIWITASANPSLLVKYTTGGSYVSNVTLSPTTYTRGLTWDGNNFRVMARGGAVHTYGTDGARDSSSGATFGTAMDAEGLTWDGAKFWIVEGGSGNDLERYDTSGTREATYNLNGNNSDPKGVAWDGVALWVVDLEDNKVYAYEGTGGPTTNHGLSPDADYVGTLSATVATHGDWKCIQSSSGETLTAYNSTLTVHGFCAQNDGSNGMAVEVHVGTTTTYAVFKRFVDVTGLWWFVKEGAAARLDARIYSDTYTDLDTLAFTEEAGGLNESSRLGFSTKAKAVTDTNCQEDSGEGFACSRTYLSQLDSGDDAVLVFGADDSNSVESAGTPSVPDSVQVSRNADYTVATITWELYDTVTAYEVQRHTAVLVDVADATRIEYGDPVTYRVVGTSAGVREHVDSTVEAHRTYQFRVRGRGAASDSWSDWSELVFSGAKPKVDLSPPGNLGLAHMGSSITASWTAPPGDFDNYTLQRQELVIVEGSTFFANVKTLSATGSVWLPVDPTVYDDTHIIPSQTYEYRIAAVLDNQVGVYSDWFRIGPPNTSLGAAPANFQFLTSGARVLDARREYWMSWDATSGADDYEVQVLILKLRAVQRVESRIVTDTTYFRTAFGRSAFRVRGRKVDEKICGSAVDDRCLTEWTGWFGMPFTPKVQIPAPPTATPATSTLNLRTEMEGVIESVLGESTGADVNGGYVLQFLMLLMAVVVSAMTIAITWRRGMAPLGVGMACAISILIFFAGYRLFGTPLAWAVALQLLVAAAGLFALVRQVGVFR